MYVRFDRAPVSQTDIVYNGFKASFPEETMDWRCLLITFDSLDPDDKDLEKFWGEISGCTSLTLKVLRRCWLL